MRDWNASGLERIGGIIAVWAYLWGIESVNEDSANPPEEGFRSIYEGFENLNCQGILKKHIESLARNLKKEFLIKEIIKKYLKIIK